MAVKFGDNVSKRILVGDVEVLASDWAEAAHIDFLFWLLCRYL
jgi:hypothetical protein